MVKTKSTSKKDKRKLLALLILSVILIGGGIYAYKQNRSDNATGKTQTGSQTDTINLEPATEADKKRSDENKQEIVERDQNVQNQQPSGTTKQSVKPVISYASQLYTSGAVEVGAYVNGVFEDGGTCTATFKLGSSSFIKSVTAVKNVNAVNCPVMSATANEFTPKGTWSVTVSYDSKTASGLSDARQIEVK